MRFIPAGVHGALDYAMGALLIVSPWIFGFAAVPTAKWLVIILGVGVILYSALTAYQWGAAALIPMPVHLWLDGLGGALLIIAPWLLGFSASVWIPHVILGVIEVAAALTTETRVPSTDRR